jgi:membrane protein YdbS with pleckstrin-like domain
METVTQKPRYRHLGFRAYWMFFFQKAKVMLGIAIALVFLSKLREIIVLTPELHVLLENSLIALLLLFLLTFVGSLLVAAVQYIAYEFMLDEHALKIRSGILNLQIEAIPYRQMQNIDIERDIIYRILGISRLVILTAGTEDANSDNESEGIIPALDKNVAHEIQQELIRRANQEKIIVRTV